MQLKTIGAGVARVTGGTRITSLASITGAELQDLKLTRGGDG